MTKRPGRQVQPAPGGVSSSVASQGQKLGLRTLLHYLRDQAELTHWKPGFASRRNWAMTLMLTTAEWLPLDDAWERQLINTLVQNGRSFIKGLGYNSAPDQALVAASLLDCDAAPHPLFIDRDHSHGDALAPVLATLNPCGNSPAWRWLPACGDMSALPTLQPRRAAAPLP